MQTYNLLKVNLAGKGYTHIWMEGANILDLKTIDEALPIVKSDPSTTNMAYAVTKISKDKIFVALGFNWSKLQDEYSRNGLSFWHGKLCILSEKDNNAQFLIANILLGLIIKYQAALQQLRDIISKIAVEQNSEALLKRIGGLSADLPNVINKKTEKLISAFLEKKDILPPKANLNTRFPFHEDLAIPCLLSLMFQKDNPITKFAGGCLSVDDLSMYRYISSSKQMPGYATIDISDFLLDSSKTLFSMEKNSLLINLLLLFLSCLVLIFLGYMFLRPLLSLFR